MGIFDYKNYHLVGIGGIGISAIARMMHLRGKKVSGSDSGKSEITDDLEKLGIKIHIGHRAENLSRDAEIVIYTIAVPQDNPELAEAKRRGLPAITYPQALGEISKSMKTIAVSGTHGKTTTTAMLGHIMKKADLDPTVIVGSKLLGANSNFIAGKSEYLVVEACEYRRSFLNLHPYILVITNIDADHLDYYKDLDDIKSAFREMEAKVPKDGFVVKEEDYKKVETDFTLLIPGKHNITDAQAAIKAAELLGIPQQKSKEYLRDFKGTWRRLEFKGSTRRPVGINSDMIFYDDYAHHPAEIAASLSALREKHPDKELVCVFEPHQQSRTKLLLDDFAKSLSLADKVFVAPVLITREADDGVTTNRTLAEAINADNQIEIASPVDNPDHLKNLLQNSDSRKPLCLVFMGAGNIYKWTPEFL